MIDNSSTSYTIDFTGYDASGFEPNPAAGRLDSDTWSVIGLSDGDLLFGASGTSGDYARGTSTGGATTAGIYSFDNGTSGSMLGVQAAGSDFTPGEFRLRVENNSGDTLYAIQIAYSVWIYNDQGRSNKMAFGHSMDNNSYISHPSLDVFSPEAADPTPTWTEVQRDTTIDGLDLASGDSIYFRWLGDDVSGSGSRDEIGIDNISVTGFGSSLDAAFGMSEDTVCAGTLIDYNDSSTVNNDSIVLWEWDFGNGDTAMQENPTYDHGTPGIYDVGLKVTTQGGLVDSTTRTLVVNAVDDASFHYDSSSYCDQDSDPTPTITGDPGGTFSEGSGGLSIDSTTGTIDLSASPSGNYVVFYETDGECANATTFEVELVDQYDASIDPVGTLCDSDTLIDLTAPQEGGDWTGPGVVNDSTGAFNPSVAGVGTHQVIHDIPGPCGDADTLNIEVTDQLDASIDPVGTYCLPSVTDVLSAADSGGVWSGPGIIDSVTGEFSPNDAGQGTHTIVYEIEGNCGDIDSIDIQVDSSANASIDPAGPFCENTDTVNLTATDTGGTWSGAGIVDTVDGEFLPAEAGPGTHTLIHEIDGVCGDIDSESIQVFDGKDGSIDSAGPYCVLDPPDTLGGTDTAGATWSGPGIIDTTEGVFDPGIAGPGDHQIQLNFGSQDSCSVGDTVTITVKPIPNADIDSIGPVCINDGIVELTAVDSGGTWSGTGIVGPSSGDLDPTLVGAGNNSTVEYEVQGLGACVDSDSLQVSVLDTPSADFSFTKNGYTVEFSDSSNGASITYWEFGDGSSSSDMDPDHTYSEDSLYNACLHVADTNGCTDTLCKEVDLRDVSVPDRKLDAGGLEIRPNPASFRVHILLSERIISASPEKLELLEMSGRIVRERSLGMDRERVSLDLSKLPPGPYIIRIRSQEGSIQRKLLIR